MNPIRTCHEDQSPKARRAEKPVTRRDVPARLITRMPNGVAFSRAALAQDTTERGNRPGRCCGPDGVGCNALLACPSHYERYIRMAAAETSVKSASHPTRSSGPDVDQAVAVAIAVISAITPRNSPDRRRADGPRRA